MRRSAGSSSPTSTSVPGMASMTAPSTPIVIVLFGGTGDLAKRMVIPAFYTLFLQKLLPSDFVLVGNGRGDVSHEDFRGHVHDVLTEFGTKPEGKDWEEFADRLRFAGGGFDSDNPGSLLDVIAEARKQLGDSCELVHYLAMPPVAFADLTAGLGAHDLAEGARVVYEKPFGTSPENFRELDEAVHKVLDEIAGLPDRPFPGQGGHPGPARPAIRQQPVRERLERRAHQGHPDRRAGEARHRRPGAVLRRDRRDARHVDHPPVPGRRRGGHGTAGEHERRRPAVRPGRGDRLLPAAGPGRGGARSVRRLPAT